MTLTKTTRTKTLDIRASTCHGGGAIWSLLSHARDLPLGSSIEILTDDELAPSDIPEWVKHEGWHLLEHRAEPGYVKFVLRKPRSKPQIQTRIAAARS